MASSSRPSTAPRTTWLGPGVVGGAVLGLLWIHDLASCPGLAAGLLSVGFLGLWLGARSGVSVSPPRVLLVAALLRVVLLPLPPTLTTDVWRYLWDGRVATHGENPYRLEPDSPSLAPLRDGVWERLDHRDVPTVYPPLAVTLFSICARLPASLWAWKTLVAATDLLTCWWLLRLARELGLPPRRVAWYAWNPLVVLETAGMGHVDALAVAATVGAVLLLRRGSWWGSAGAAAAGALAKLGPLAAWPLWARSSRRPLRYLAVAGGITAVALAPVVVSTGGVPPGLVTYAVSWEFDGPVFEPLWRGLDAAGAADRVKGALDEVKLRTGEHERWNRVYPLVYPQLLAKVVLAALALGVWVAAWRIREPERATGFLFGGLLLCSATVYPWYLLWVLPWAALLGWSPWLWLSLFIPWSYLAGVAGVPLWPALWASIWAPFFGLGLWTVAKGFRARRRERIVPP